jgi:predicted RecB family nuclease
MHRAGLIGTTWTDGPVDGLGAMIGAWACDAEAQETGVTLPQIELMREIGRYNEVDCRSMAEVLGWLRANR